MKLVFVVDEDAATLCSALNTTAKRDTVDLEFEALLTPDQMFSRISSKRPDLVLLHHNWSGISISKILERLVAVCDDARVIVFTGQTIRIAELIECVRSGVADYWRKDAMATEFMFRQISYYCASPAWAIKILKTASGTVAQLAERAEKESELRREGERLLEASNRRVQDWEFREKVSTGKFRRSLVAIVVIIAGLLAAFLIANTVTGGNPKWSLAFVIVCGVTVLFFMGRISLAQFNWKDGSAVVESKRDTKEGKEG